MGRRMRTVASLLLAVAVAGCTDTTTSPAPTSASSRGPVDSLLDTAAAEAGVPRDLLLAIAVEESGLELPAYRMVDPADDDHVPVAGLLELRHGRLDTLALGAKLAGVTEADLRADTALATRAGALVVADLGRQTGATPSDLGSWRRALELLSGLDDDTAHTYAERVFSHLRTGGTFAARAGEHVALVPHLDVPLPTTAALIVPAQTPDFPGAIWFTTSCANDKCQVGRPLGHASVNKIVIHDTEGGWNASVATLQNDPGKGVHYIIDKDGSRVGQFRSENDTTYHAGNFYYNETSVGIEHVGVAADPAGYETGLYKKSQELVRSIRERWSVPLDREHIFGHYQVPNGRTISESSAACAAGLDACETSANYGGAGNHRDPGYNWQWCQYMEGLGGTCNCNDAWSHFNCTTDLTEAVRCTNGTTLEIQHCTAGCVVQPIGQDDQCNMTPDPDPTPNPDPMPDPDPTPDGMKDAGGCSTSGDASPFALLAALGAVLVSRRRRA